MARMPNPCDFYNNSEDVSGIPDTYVHLIDPEDGPTTRKFMGELKKCIDDKYHRRVFYKKTEYVPLVVVVRRTTLRCEDDLDAALERIENQKSKKVDVIVYFHMKRIGDCKETARRPDVMEKYKHMVIIDMDFGKGNLTSWGSVKNVNKNAIEELIKTVRDLQDLCFEKTLYVYTYPNVDARVSGVIIEELENFMEDELVIKKSDHWYGCEPLAIICDDEAPNGMDPSNVAVFHLFKGDAYDNPKQENMRKQFGLVIDISEEKGKYFITYNIGTKLIDFVKGCSVRKRKECANHRTENSSNDTEDDGNESSARGTFACNS
ncbi:uncharacterized protein LOC128559487 [Mercenaria mercenaria]|uniref:uncharacterized protein LOC128559487 n=1 Tax=Mercenaria mercenaria TaxID=6596 RepID=UPI00234E581E|nr:uncharacterized protein LOC128559487 [Mercenaria mercenaria]